MRRQQRRPRQKKSSARKPAARKPAAKKSVAKESMVNEPAGIKNPYDESSSSNDESESDTKSSAVSAAACNETAATKPLTSWTKVELQHELEKLGLPNGGLKHELIDRLEMANQGDQTENEARVKK